MRVRKKNQLAWARKMQRRKAAEEAEIAAKVLGRITFTYPVHGRSVQPIRYTAELNNLTGKWVVK